jgi:hypothetical protein
VLLTVADTGPGIKPEDMGRIFEAFFTTKPQGMGMGLSICRSIVEAHQRRLWASAATPHGTIFHMQLPLRGGAGASERSVVGLDGNRGFRAHSGPPFCARMGGTRFAKGRGCSLRSTLSFVPRNRVWRSTHQQR